MLKINCSFKEHIKKYIITENLFKPTKQTKYTLDQILDVIEYILITGSSWRSLNLSIFKNVGIKWQSIFYHFNKFSRYKVFEKVYMIILNKYFKKNMSGKLKYLSIDTSFVKNEYASNVGFNGFYKKKRLSKLSLIVDSNGVPLSAVLAKGNTSDITLFDKNINDMFIKINYKHNKHKRYMLADAIYNTKHINEAISLLNMKPLIWKYNRKYNGSLKNNKFNKKEINIYKKRRIIENCFSW